MTAQLDNAAMRAHRRKMAGLIEEPDTFPFVEEIAKILGREDQFLGATARLGRVHRYQTARIDSRHPRHGNGPKYLTHPCVSSVGSRSVCGAIGHRSRLRFLPSPGNPAGKPTRPQPVRRPVFDKSGEKRREDSHFHRQRRGQCLENLPRALERSARPYGACVPKTVTKVFLTNDFRQLRGRVFRWRRPVR